MKIIHKSGQAYDLPSNFQLEMTRTNPFFHKKGEQSLPCSLPPTGNNMALLGQPTNIGNKKKIEGRIDVSIESGSFFMRARQAVLSAKRKRPIEASFYLNEGAFYERMENLTLKDVFKDKSVEFNNVDAAINFVFSLLTQNDDRFSCCMVSTEDTVLNYIDHANPTQFRHAVSRITMIEDKEVQIPKGMFITPFIKVRHVLQEVAEYLGYTLDSSFMDSEPFSKMLFLNNNIDTIILGRIDYVDVIPDLSLHQFFDIFRKFNHEIVTDEINKKLKLVNFDDCLQDSNIDLTKVLNDELSIEYHNNYRQLKLSSKILNAPDAENKFAGYEANAENGFTTINELAQQFPSARIQNSDGSIYRIGYKGEREVIERLGSLHCNYFSGDTLNEEDKSFPDTIVEIIKSVFVTQNGEGGAIISMKDVLFAYVGKARALRTKLIFDDEQEDGNNGTKSAEHQKLEAMLCFYYQDIELGFNTATIHNYNLLGDKLWDYSLAYNGDDGIFEKFWRKYDDLLRNALLEVRGELLLSESQKMMLSSYKSVKLNSQKLIPSEIKYVPGVKVPQECTFLTTNLQEPIDRAKYISEYFQNSIYKWVLKTQRNFSNNPPAGTWEIIKYKSEPTVYFPNNPTQEQFNAGGQYFNMSYDVEYGYATLFSYTRVGDGVITTWLEPALYQ